MAPGANYDYVIVGSGAGGGTLAARLAEAGMRVCVLEAGSDPYDEGAGLPEQYDVPAFHPLASENRGISWEFFVRHYSDAKRQRADWKWRPNPDTGEPSIFYPRAGTLGGCTAHNAMIFIAPNDSDWDHIAALTGDSSWRAYNMRRYFQRLEECRHRTLRRLLKKWFGSDPSAHGWDGWLPAERALPRRVRDFQLFRTVLSSALTVIFEAPDWTTAIRRLMRGEADPNDWRRLRKRAEGLCYAPLSTDWHQRKGTRERLIEAARKHPDKLHIELDALATRVIFGEGNRAAGIEYLKGKHLYRAHPEPRRETGAPREIHAAREVILAGGAFNTPQLLMLSGIGPRHVLEAHGIEVRYDLEGVGKNLQDRYEVVIVHRMRKPWKSLKDARFERDDRLYKEWSRHRKDWHGHGGGMYIANGAALAFSRRSSPVLPEPDLFCMALLAPFRGYYPGYAAAVCEPHDVPEHSDYLTWAILKAYSGSRGTVTLRSSDPRDRPNIEFRYFEETAGSAASDDAKAVVSGIRLVRKITARLKSQGLIGGEELPGEALQSDEELAQHVRDTAWGHHASCTCSIGPPSDKGVLSSDFKVHGTQNLRVVDASVFPRIPGFFIASAVYMIAEKAADVILQDAACFRAAQDKG